MTELRSQFLPLELAKQLHEMGIMKDVEPCAWFVNGIIKYELPDYEPVIVHSNPHAKSGHKCNSCGFIFSRECLDKIRAKRKKVKVKCHCSEWLYDDYQSKDWLEYQTPEIIPTRTSDELFAALPEGLRYYITLDIKRVKFDINSTDFKSAIMVYRRIMQYYRELDWLHIWYETIMYLHKARKNKEKRELQTQHKENI